ncbi:MAG: glutamate 5-kinase [Endomicrobia bacterium]|nr:glutamate 5-kinase [Endomicrobiia bacterium]MCX7940964.1 glutamate 5-kinase [Endomicrobiia bacterium]MDW8055635.1 glutamate 5-kinase [Elusimicrobiota bacterium]
MNSENLKYCRVVVKIGSHLIVSGSDEFITSIAKQVKVLREHKCEIIIVSSGAIATGLKEYDVNSKPKTIIEKQCYAAVGQPLLMNKYIKAFQPYNITVAQILLTREDFDDRKRYVNIKNTLNKLLHMNVVPIINENDTVATEEIKLGDNDTLSAIVATKLDAELLVLLTDVDGIYDKDPAVYANAKIIREIQNLDEIERECRISTKSKFFCGTGGMKTKLAAAKICVHSGVDVVIANGMKNNILVDIVEGKTVGTKIYSVKKANRVTSRDKWIAFVSKPKGRIFVDSGAADAIIKKNKSLLPVGIRKTEGMFKKGDVVSVCTIDGKEIARGIVNYSSEEIEVIKKKKTEEIKKIFPQFSTEEVIHVDNLVILN